MKNTRIIARLDVKNSNLIKSINLEGLKVVGNPNDFAKKYYDQGVDELLFMDCVATLYGRNNLSEIISQSTKDIFVPIAVGGGIRTVQDAQNLLKSGADKVAINTAAVQNPNFISELANVIGSQSVVLSIEAKKRNNFWEVYTSNGRDPTGKNVIDWVKESEKLGAGEVLLTSVDQEGTRKGFDIDLIKSVTNSIRLPVICSGGYGETTHAKKLIENCEVDAIAIADAFHYSRATVREIKKTLNLSL
jgi:cyclase|tara:strand:- start:5085 stop:5825 length:741 start_codon:yes stop_codon:yes gene_type:complete